MLGSEIDNQVTMSKRDWVRYNNQPAMFLLRECFDPFLDLRAIVYACCNHIDSHRGGGVLNYLKNQKLGILSGL